MGKFNAKFQGGKGGQKRPMSKYKKPARKDGSVNKVDEKSKSISKPAPTVTNPFEVKINKQKFQVLGRPTKHEKGLPGVSRAKALKKRQETLLLEYKNKFKSNKMVDKRLGEKDPNLTLESKMEMRFLAEKAKSQNNKKSRFLLGDDEVLTHRGQTLADIEKFDDPRSDDDEDDEERLGKSFVSDAHFGGGVLKKSDETEEARHNRESLIDNLIAESKKRKEERQKEREETDDLTDKLDEEYKDVLDVLAGIRNPKKSEVEPVKLPDSDYDILVRQLRFDPRATPKDKLKSPDEIARLEKEKLEKLEADRLKRMRGDPSSSKVIPHRSADDLDDGFTYRPEKPQVKTLSFSMDANDSTPQEPEGEESDQEEGEEEEGEESDKDDDDDEAEDSYSDLASEDDEDEEPENQKEKESTKKSPKTASAKSKVTSKSDMPFVFKVPDEYDEFQELLQAYSNAEQKVVLERMIKSNHPALSGNNKPKMEKVFTFLMQYIHDIASSSSITILNDLTPVVFDLAQLLPSTTVASLMLDILMEKREELSSQSKKRRVSLATLIFLKLTALIFPTSDFRHPVTTPAFFLLMEALSCPVISLQAVQMGLALCTVAYEFVSLSKRYIPEVVHFLHGIIHIAIPRPAHLAAPSLVYPFRPVGTESQLLVLTGENTKSIDADRIRLDETEFKDEFRVASLSVGVKLLTDFLALWIELPAIADIYSPILTGLRKLPLERYNSKLGESVTKLIAQVEQVSAKTRKRLVHEAKKPKPLRLYEPAIEEHFDGGKKRVGSKEKQERDKLQHKLKREMKGAIREIRKDNAFIARQKLKEQIERDSERKRKVKDLMSSLAMQEGEVRKMKRPKKK